MERTGSLIGIWMLSPRRLGFEVYAKLKSVCFS